jgi:hypothetical protein
MKAGRGISDGCTGCTPGLQSQSSQSCRIQGTLAEQMALILGCFEVTLPLRGQFGVNVTLA